MSVTSDLCASWREIWYFLLKMVVDMAGRSGKESGTYSSLSICQQYEKPKWKQYICRSKISILPVKLVGFWVLKLRS
jgi:hypothetical protein